MPTRKIADLPKEETCQHPEHFPPRERMFPPGVYEHECPECGYVKKFTVRPMVYARWDNPVTIR